MGTRKKAIELVFNLQWRNKPDNGCDKSNIIGMYDTPTTTSNFEMFKSYLLKNSGVAGNDVKVSYITDNGQEWVIDSQEWFELALSAFRLKARLGEVIFLKLDKIFSSKHITRKHSNDVETQFDVDSMDNSMVAPPEWFVTYMKQFKRDIVEEVTFAVTANMTANKDKERVKEKECVSVPTVSSSSKRNKHDSTKRSRKHLHGENATDKEFLKTLKFDMKLLSKLDKLDAKTKKIKEKEQALINKISFADDVKQSEKSLDTDTAKLMNASFVTQESISDGDTYLHTWQVMNSGTLPWTKDTELRLTWGSVDLMPFTRTIRCPPLQVGEKGTILVRFEKPKNHGNYESYWNFYHKDVRFGKSLSCNIMVERPLSSVLVDVTSKIPSKKFMFCDKDGKYINDSQDIADSQDNFDYNGKVTKVKGVSVKIPEGTKHISCYEGVLDNGCTTLSVPKEAKRFIFFPQEEEKKGTQNSNSSSVTKRGEEMFNFLKEKGCNPNTSLCSLAAESEQIRSTVREMMTNSNFDLNLMAEEQDRLIILLKDKVEHSNSDLIAVNETDQLAISLKEEARRLGSSYEFTPVVTVKPTLHEPETKNKSAESVPDSADTNIHNTVMMPPGLYVLKTRNDCPLTLPPLAETSQGNASTPLSSSVMDLSRRIQNMKIAGDSHPDSDSEWENVWCYGDYKNKDDNLTIDFGPKKTNCYGISEKDLIVDLSKNSKGDKKVKNEQESVEANDDKNNNNGAGDNNSTGESISEIASEASDLSSGYDVVNVSAGEEGEENSGYVYITFDGNKLPVPKHILRPDFLIGAEEAPGPLNTDDEEKIDKEPQEKVSSRTSPAKMEQTSPKQESKSFMTHCSATGSSFSDVPSGSRLFIFPENNPGFEVVYAQESQESSASAKPQYTWATSSLRYVPSDPYGPLDQSQAGINATSAATGHPLSGDSTSAHPAPIPHYCNQKSDPDQPGDQLNKHMQHGHGLPHLSPKPAPKKETPSAPPQPNQSTEFTPSPVHILPENLVSGAVNVASSAINTARTVINMITPKTEPGKWVNGHWVTENPESVRAKNLIILSEMGFYDADFNATLLARYNDDLTRVISELIQ